ncbi:MAG TPA: GDSL-type esterase/lipase family protein [Anaerolineales bacterium]|nr:GDSL-type esterase/lipase family protein [Anaerolineales bacterium]
MKHTVNFRFFFLLTLLPFAFHSYGQDALRFKDEVAQLTANDQSLNRKDIILFTGSSSIVMWNSLQADFPKYNILNRGFGGSQTSDLLFYFDQLILAYNPKKIFIYEGDNDISAGKSTDQILSSMDSLITLIRQKVSATVPVYVISPKPSIARWNLKDKYVEFNTRMAQLASTKEQVYFVDVWTPAIGGDGTVLKDIFIEDGLHMNQKGYAIWANVIRRYLP